MRRSEDSIWAAQNRLEELWSMDKLALVRERRVI